MKILVLEDQESPLESLGLAIRKVFPKFYHGSEPELNIARSYKGAKRLISANQYDFAFIDHRVPWDDLGDMEKNDFDSFCSLLEEIGYSLINEVKKASPNVVVIGTSSLSDKELRRFPQPDYKISKGWNEAEGDLRRVLSELK